MYKKYKNILVFLSISSFFSYVFTYLGIAVSSSLSPLIFIILTILFTSILVLSNTKQSIKYILINPLYRWMIVYFIIILIWIILPNAQASYKTVRLYILSIIFMFTMTTLMSFDNEKLSVARHAVLFATLVAILNNVYEFFYPETFFLIESKYKLLGRSAGFYINANISGEAIILGLIFSYSIVPKRLKTLFIFATFLGVLSSFSRTGILSWFIVVFLLSWTKVIERKKVFIISLVAFVSIIVVLPFLIDYIETNLEAASSNLLNRLNFFSSSQQNLDGSQRERLEIAKLAFEYFASNPFLGMGIGFFEHWEYKVLPHNIYLKLMVEYGILGFFIFPSLIFICVWKSTNDAKKISLAFGVYALLTGFTTHHSLEGYHYLIAFSLMASMNIKSRKQLR